MIDVIDAICGLCEDTSTTTVAPVAAPAPASSIIPKDAKPFSAETNKPANQAAQANPQGMSAGQEPLIPTSVSLVAPNATPKSEEPLSPQQIPGAQNGQIDPAIAIMLGKPLPVAPQPAAPAPAPAAPAVESLVQETLASMGVSAPGSTGSVPKSAAAIAAALTAGTLKDEPVGVKPGHSVMATMHGIFGNKLR